jgi:hypothetical protein
MISAFEVNGNIYWPVRIDICVPHIQRNLNIGYTLRTYIRLFLKPCSSFLFQRPFILQVSQSRRQALLPISRSSWTLFSLKWVITPSSVTLGTTLVRRSKWGPTVSWPPSTPNSSSPVGSGIIVSASSPLTRVRWDMQIYRRVEYRCRMRSTQFPDKPYLIQSNCTPLDGSPWVDANTFNLFKLIS